ncbi:tRNA (guanosine(46)-N7)-methyltransferase TrmB [Listeria ilorinensis]|uniref:tRNA (guanosine(46)-N7)-methyltransferase TrmB n=1 Tax=Listeria ilorinensis TaxID=2867439 RepID=UPI001EF5219A|nr:tRNA (guanosine(46)-N7)-methyltransferase TrmB [Listeria ilorinensis]
MRVKHKPWAKEKLAAHSAVVIQDPASCKGRWNEIFDNDQPIHIEIGSGKGQFVAGMAKQNPTINYIGIEIVESVLVLALDKVLAAETPNVRLLAVDGAALQEYFEPEEISRIYLNFSDPWPKKRHAKRRLTNPRFLTLYQALLPKEGEIHFKTDNRGLFEYSLHALSEYGMVLHNISLDLHKSNFEGNVMTEYEEKFSQQGYPIYRLEAVFRSN